MALRLLYSHVFRFPDDLEFFWGRLQDIVRARNQFAVLNRFKSGGSAVIEVKVNVAYSFDVVFGTGRSVVLQGVHSQIYVGASETTDQFEFGTAKEADQHAEAEPDEAHHGQDS
jgi:hypothetical protein